MPANATARSAGGPAGCGTTALPSKVTVEGEGAGYRAGRLLARPRGTARPAAAPPTGPPIDPTYERMGVNLRMFEPELWRDLPRRFIDGAS